MNIIIRFINMELKGLHHIAIICSDYEVSKNFYTRILGMNVDDEHYRADRKSWKAELSIDGHYIIELFSFPDSPARQSYPEATGLRHIAFQVDDIDESACFLDANAIERAEKRIDEFTGKRFLFFFDPDKLPIELYEK